MSRKLNIIKPLVAFVLGGPGSGKGTQCKFISEEFGFKHLSAGDLLRAERNTPGSPFGEMIEQTIREGKIVPVEVTCSLIENAMLEHQSQQGDTTSRGQFLIDGFPRNYDNLTGWTKQLGDKVDLLFVIFLDCPHDICIERCLKRGESGSQRSDDNEESLRKRLVTYTQDTMPIVEHYRSLGLLRSIDATKSPSEVYKEVKSLFSNLPSQ